MAPKMAPRKLTEKTLQNLKAKGERYEVKDTTRAGLSVRVGTRGTLTFIYRYQVHGKRRKMTLGQYGIEPTKTLADAYTVHHDAWTLARAGIDPQHEAEEAAAKEAAAEEETAEEPGYTVKDVAEEFRDRHLIPNVKTWAETWRIIEKDILPEWGEREADTITPREVVLLLDGILDRGAARMANKVRSILFQMFRFAVGRGMAETSPVVLVTRPSAETRTRDRILTDDELRAFWHKLDSAVLLPRLRPALRLLLITGQRRGEVALATWDEFDEDAKIWTIPAARTKNGKAHTVPLTPLALDTLKTLRATLAEPRKGAEEGYTGPYLFPSSRWSTEGPIDPKALTRAISRDRKHWGIAAFTVHDLRRTVRSNLAALGVDPVVAKKVLNHTLSGMDAIYDRHTYAEEKRQALTLWADHLQAVIRGKRSKVTPLRAEAG